MRLMAALLAFLLPLGCGGSQDGGTVIYVRGDPTDSLDPASTEWGGSAKIIQQMYESLVTFADDGVEIVPHLAEKWTTSEDGRTWTFTLRKDVKFHDGTPLDAAAVAFTFERLLRDGPHTPPSVPYRSHYADIEKIDAPDSSTVAFRLGKPSAVFLMNLAMWPAAIVSPAAVKKEGAGFARNPSGTGPMMLKTWDPGVKVTLVRNPSYWGTPAKIGRLIILDVKDVQTAIQKLKNGEAHVIDNITLADIAAIEKDAKLQMEYEVSMNVCYLGFNMRKAPYNDPNFRKAVAHAIDRRKVIEIAYHGKAEAARSIVPPSIFKAPEGVESAYDPQKAKEYLAKAPAEAREVTLWHMSYPRPYVQEPDKVAQVIKDDLSRIGINVKLEGFHVDIYTKRIKDPEHPMFLLGWSADIADADNFLFALLHGASIGDGPKGPTGTNSSFFNNPRFNEVVLAAQTEIDAAKRAALYNEALRILGDEVPVVPLVHVRQMAACSKKVRYNHHPIEYRLWKIHFAP